MALGALSRMETWCLPSVGVPVTIEILFALVLVKFDEHSRSAQTDPAVVALYGDALATLEPISAAVKMVRFISPRLL